MIHSKMKLVTAAAFLTLFFAGCSSAPPKSTLENNSESDQKSEKTSSTEATENGKPEEIVPIPLTDEEVVERLNTRLQEENLHIIDGFLYQESSLSEQRLYETLGISNLGGEYSHDLNSGRLQTLKSILTEIPNGYGLQITGHDDRMNVTHRVVSQNRAKYIADLLNEIPEIKKIPKKILGAGARQYLSPGFSKDGYDKNRRVEIVIVKL